MSLALAKAQKPTKRQIRKRKKKTAPPPTEDDLVRDKQGVVISAHGRDKGTPELNRHGNTRETLVYFGGDNKGLKRSRAYVRRTTDLLDDLLRNRFITAEEARAGGQFRRDFETGQLDPRRAPDMGRIPNLGGKREEADRLIEARNRIADAMAYLGGYGSRMGRCAWWCLGAEMTMTQFGESGYFGGGRVINRKDARQIVVVTLETLARYYYGEQRKQGSAY